MKTKKKNEFIKNNILHKIQIHIIFIYFQLETSRNNLQKHSIKLYKSIF